MRKCFLNSSVTHNEIQSQRCNWPLKSCWITKPLVTTDQILSSALRVLASCCPTNFCCTVLTNERHCVVRAWNPRLFEQASTHVITSCTIRLLSCIPFLKTACACIVSKLIYNRGSVDARHLYSSSITFRRKAPKPASTGPSSKRSSVFRERGGFGKAVIQSHILNCSAFAISKLWRAEACPMGIATWILQTAEPSEYIQAVLSFSQFSSFCYQLRMTEPKRQPFKNIQVPNAFQTFPRNSHTLHQHLKGW